MSDDEDSESCITFEDLVLDVKRLIVAEFFDDPSRIFFALTSRENLAFVRSFKFSYSGLSSKISSYVGEVGSMNLLIYLGKCGWELSSYSIVESSIRHSRLSFLGKLGWKIFGDNILFQFDTVAPELRSATLNRATLSSCIGQSGSQEVLAWFKARNVSISFAHIVAGASLMGHTTLFKSVLKGKQFNSLELTEILKFAVLGGNLSHLQYMFDNKYVAVNSTQSRETPFVSPDKLFSSDGNDVKRPPDYLKIILYLEQSQGVDFSKRSLLQAAILATFHSNSIPALTYLLKNHDGTDLMYNFHNSSFWDGSCKRSIQVLAEASPTILYNHLYYYCTPMPSKVLACFSPHPEISIAELETMAWILRLLRNFDIPFPASWPSLFVSPYRRPPFSEFSLQGDISTAHLNSDLIDVLHEFYLNGFRIPSSDLCALLTYCNDSNRLCSFLDDYLDVIDFPQKDEVNFYKSALIRSDKTSSEVLVQLLLSKLKYKLSEDELKQLSVTAVSGVEKLKVNTDYRTWFNYQSQTLPERT